MGRQWLYWLSIVILALAAVPNFSACDEVDTATECSENEDCPEGYRCEFGTCTEMLPPAEDATSDTGTGGGTENVIECNDGVVPQANELRFNEIHAAPSAEDDVNCDGLLDGSKEEFIELVNATDKTLDVSGIELQYDGTTKHVLQGCILPGSGMVIYTQQLEPHCDFGDTVAVPADNAIKLSNSGKSLALIKDGEPIDQVAYPSLSGVSWTRAPDFTGDFVKHNEVSPLVTLNFSPGQCVDGSPLHLGCIPPSFADTCPDSRPVAPGDVLINEVHAGPKTGDLAHDSNCDGVASSSQDEFVEFVNVSGEKLLLEGVKLYVNDTVKSTINLCLPADRGFVVYSGGTPKCDLGETPALVSDSSLGLTNSGGYVGLYLADESDVIDGYNYASVVSNNSWNRNPDFTGTDFVPHQDMTDAIGPQSAGKCANGAPLALGCVIQTCNEDGVCDPGETVALCPLDCACNENGQCEAFEDMSTCPNDCNCNEDGTCDPSENADICPQDCALPKPTVELRINEINAAPESGNMAHDANCDGIINTSDDEFVEIVNNSDKTLDLSGVSLQVNGNTKFEFAPNLTELGPREVVVIYGGGTPSCTNLGDLVHTFVSSLSLTNSGGSVILVDQTNGTLDGVTYPDLGDSTRDSYVRVPDYTGESFQEHTEADVVDHRVQSAGLCINGAQFPNCPSEIEPPVCNENGQCDGNEDALSCPEECYCGDGICSNGEDQSSCSVDCSSIYCGDGICNGTETYENCPDDCTCGNGVCDPSEDESSCPSDCSVSGCTGSVPLQPGYFVINEIHAAPLSGIDDINCDGNTQSSYEEFIELVNTQNAPLDLQDLTLTVNGSVELTITECIPPYGAVVVYRSTLSSWNCNVGEFVSAYSASISLSNSADGTIALLDASGAILDTVTYPASDLSAGHESYTRDPDYVGNFVLHTQANGGQSARSSSGLCNDATTLFPNCHP